MDSALKGINEHRKQPDKQDIYERKIRK